MQSVAASKAMPMGLPPQTPSSPAAAVAVELPSLPGRSGGVPVVDAGKQWTTVFWAGYLKPVLIACVPNPGYFLAGGTAGIVSRTATAPLDRLKVYLIAQTDVAQETVQAAKSGAFLSALKNSGRQLVNATRDLWAAGGIRSLYAGESLSQTSRYRRTGTPV